MSRYVFKLPDLGEGTVDAEIVAWRVKPGDIVAEDDVVVEVMTDKAAVEVPAPVSGRVVSTTGSPGDSVPVGAELIVFETQPDSAAASAGAAPSAATAKSFVPAASSATATKSSLPAASSATAAKSSAPAATEPAASRKVTPIGSAGGGEGPQPTRRGNGSANGHGASTRSARVATSPAVRRRAHEAGVDLAQLTGTGPHGRIVRADLESFVASRQSAKPHGRHETRRRDAVDTVEEIKVIGIRRVIAQRMSESKRSIPHFAYVEELDTTELEELRRHLNTQQKAGANALTYLPFIVCALVRVLEDFPQCNALYDSDRGVIMRHSAVHVGIATQTPDGLKVPVVRDAGSLSLWELAASIREVTEAARTNKATREQLSGSTITVTSLGKLGGIASTPIINAPEVAIIGVNRAVERPVVHHGAIAIRRMMNLSSSFDHRFVDGHDAAALIQALKERLEHPATIFI